MKLLHVVYVGQRVIGTFNTAREAAACAATHNSDGENWKSIDTKAFSLRWPADKPVPAHLD